MSEKKTMTVDIEKAKPYCCTKCGNITFKRTHVMMRFNAEDVPSGKVTFMPTPVFQCEKCDHVDDEFLVVAKYKRETE